MALRLNQAADSSEADSGSRLKDNTPAEGSILISQGRAIGGALALCALSICAFAATSAAAAELTAVTCVEVEAGTGNYSNSHCATPKVEKSNFETKVLPLNTTTQVTGGSTEEEPALRGTIAGASITIKCSSTETIEPAIVNREPTTGKHTIEYTSVRTTYLNCHASLKANEARFCMIEGTTEPGGEGMISTTALKGSTTGVNHQVKVEPATGTEFTKFTIKKAGTKPATENMCFFGNDVPVSIIGSIEGEVNTTNHSHVTFTEANNGTGIKANGVAAKYLATIGGTMAFTSNTVGAETFT
jgi:hypothetical protein